MTKTATILVADVGGTKTDVALHSLLDDSLSHTLRYFNDEFSSPLDLFTTYLEKTGAVPQFACFAIAGPVGKRRTVMTNRSWVFDAELFEQALNLKEFLMINDLTALSSALPSFDAGELLTIQEGEKEVKAACGIIAPGTGLGEGMFFPLEGSFVASGSEGGHTDFGPVNAVQHRLLSWAEKRMSHVSYEAFLCGSGIGRLFQFSVEELKIVPAEKVRLALKKADDPAPVIVAGALENEPCPACTEVLRLFLDILGSEAGNLGLKLLARGGVYIGGGILPRFYERISFAGFLENFRAKGKMSKLMASIPVYLILGSNANLRGCVSYAKQYHSK